MHNFSIRQPLLVNKHVCAESVDLQSMFCSRSLPALMPRGSLRVGKRTIVSTTASSSSSSSSFNTMRNVSSQWRRGTALCKQHYPHRSPSPLLSTCDTNSSNDVTRKAFSTFDYQEKLGPLPVPPLEKTIDRFLKSCEPLLSSDGACRMLFVISLVCIYGTCKDLSDVERLSFLFSFVCLTFCSFRFVLQC